MPQLSSQGCGITSAIQRAGYHYLVGIAAVVIVVPVFTFFSHRMWIYRASCSDEGR